MSTSRHRTGTPAESEVPAAGFNPTVYRDECGTFDGLRLHQVNVEPPCSECLRGEALRLLELESIPQPATRYSRPNGRGASQRPTGKEP